MPRLPHYYRRNNASGFTLIATLMMIGLTLGVILVMSASITPRMKVIGMEKHTEYARRSALFGLQTAIGELQATAGPDQRITAAADILNTTGSNPTVTPERHYWTGIWDNSTYDPTKPTTKKFVQWLVSNADTEGAFKPLTSIKDASQETQPDDITLCKGAKKIDTVKVGKVKIDSVPEGDRYYAYWVADEGVKADLSWNEGDTTKSKEIQQATRFSAAPGPDYGFLGELFKGITYPLSKDAETFMPEILMGKDPVDLEAFLDTEENPSTSPEAPSDWLKRMRHHVTMGTRGVICDVKKGGLRRDLSLAFEMDGKEQACINSAGGTDYTCPRKFNTTIGEFVGSGSRAIDPNSATIRPLLTTAAAYPFLRHLYTLGGKETTGYPSGYTPAGKNITGYSMSAGGTLTKGGNILKASGVPIIRGTSWHSIRDYYNLYKSMINGNLLKARSFFPDSSCHEYRLTGSQTAYHPLQMYGEETNLHGQAGNGSETASNGPTNTFYRCPPLRNNYSPVLLCTRFVASVTAINYVAPNADIAVAVEPIVTLWNPYNVTLDLTTSNNPGNDSLLIDFGKFPIAIELSTTNPVQPYTPGDGRLANYFSSNGATLGNAFVGISAVLIKNFTLKPGEIKIFSMEAPAGFPAIQSTTVMNEGYTWSTTKGYVFKKTFDSSKAAKTLSINVDAGTTILTAKFSTPNNSSSISQFVGLGAYLSSDAAKRHLFVTSRAQTPYKNIITHTFSGSTSPTSKDLVGKKALLGQMTFGLTPSIWSDTSLRDNSKPVTDPVNVGYPLEVFARFNPTANLWTEGPTLFCDFNQFITMTGANDPYNFNQIIITDSKCYASPAPENNSCFGDSIEYAGKSFLPIINIPRTPLYSLLSLRHAPMSLFGNEPMQPLGNSLVPLHFPGDALFGLTDSDVYMPVIADNSWLVNDALLDRYFFSGLAPAFTNTTSYSATGTLEKSITTFLGDNSKEQISSPAIQPYIPAKKVVSEITTELNATEGYKKIGAYSFIKGPFNINSTSVPAWAALLSANAEWVMQYTDPKTGSTNSDADAGIPVTKSSHPSGNSSDAWKGFRRLTRPQIWDDKGTLDNPEDDTGLAVEIVKEIRKRGPFQSISDFVNRQLTTTETGYWGPIQAAIQNLDFNATVADEGTTPDYATGTKYFQNREAATENTSANIPGSIMQADILEPIAPRITARSDTFRIRTYGEVRSKTDPNEIVSRAFCEAVVQRLPEYYDSTSTGNKPWDDDTFQSTLTTGGKTLTEDNKTYGRRFKIIQIRWLTPEEL